MRNQPRPNTQAPEEVVLAENNTYAPGDFGTEPTEDCTCAVVDKRKTSSGVPGVDEEVVLAENDTYSPGTLSYGLHDT